jgi:zinc transporter ZupT
MSEPFGAVLASFVANEKSSTDAFGFMFGLTGGMMSYVCLAELLPALHASAHHGAVSPQVRVPRRAAARRLP